MEDNATSPTCPVTAFFKSNDRITVAKSGSDGHAARLPKPIVLRWALPQPLAPAAPTENARPHALGRHGAQRGLMLGCAVRR